MRKEPETSETRGSINPYLLSIGTDINGDLTPPHDDEESSELTGTVATPFTPNHNLPSNRASLGNLQVFGEVSLDSFREIIVPTEDLRVLEEEFSKNIETPLLSPNDVVPKATPSGLSLSVEENDSYNDRTLLSDDLAPTVTVTDSVFPENVPSKTTLLLSIPQTPQIKNHGQTQTSNSNSTSGLRQTVSSARNNTNNKSEPALEGSEDSSDIEVKFRQEQVDASQTVSYYPEPNEILRYSDKPQDIFTPSTLSKHTRLRQYQSSMQDIMESDDTESTSLLSRNVSNAGVASSPSTSMLTPSTAWTPSYSSLAHGQERHRRQHQHQHQHTNTTNSNNSTFPNQEEAEEDSEDRLKPFRALLKRGTKLGQYRATALCGNDATGSILYMMGPCVASSGALAPLAVAMVSGVLYLFRAIYGEAITALPLNGGAYNVLLNTTSKTGASAAAVLTLISYTATAVVSSAEAIHYLQHVLQFEASLISTGVLLLLGLFAGITMLGVGESASVALGILITHLVTMTILCLVSFYAIVSTVGLEILWHNIGLLQVSFAAIGTGLFYGFSSAMLGVTGFETSANYVEEQKRGVYVKTLRNMWWLVTIFNLTIAFLTICLLPIDEVVNKGYIATIIAHLAKKAADTAASTSPLTPLTGLLYTITGKVGESITETTVSTVGSATSSLFSDDNVIQTLSPLPSLQTNWLETIVALDAFCVLAGGVLTSFVGVTGLSRRLALDRCLPQFLLSTNRWRGTNHWIIIIFALLCGSMFIMLRQDVRTLGETYSVSFLSVMALFALGVMMIKVKRPWLVKEVSASWVTTIIAFIAVLFALYGAVSRDLVVVKAFILYFSCFFVVVLSMLHRAKLLKMVSVGLKKLPCVKKYRNYQLQKTLEEYGFTVNLNQFHGYSHYFSVVPPVSTVPAPPVSMGMTNGTVSNLLPGDMFHFLHSLRDLDDPSLHERLAALREYTDVNSQSLTPTSISTSTPNTSEAEITKTSLQSHPNQQPTQKSTQRQTQQSSSHHYYLPPSPLSQYGSSFQGFLHHPSLSCSFYSGRLLDSVVRNCEMGRRSLLEAPLGFFAKKCELSVLNKAVQYVLQNEDCKWVRIIHCFTHENEIPSTLYRDVNILVEEYPELTIDLVLIKGAFTPAMVAYVSVKLRIPRNYLFITSPQPGFGAKLGDLGGVRLITH